MPGRQADREASSASQPFEDYFGALLRSPQFQTSPRRNELLRYLVDKSTSGRGEMVSEYAIALEVFRKPESFDQRIDSTVRSEISRLRRFISSYYEGPGAHDPWRIVFPVRGYVPEVIQIHSAALPVEPEPITSKGQPHRGTIVLLAAVAVVIVALIGGAVAWSHHGGTFLRHERNPGSPEVAGNGHAVNHEAQALYLRGQYYWEHRTDGTLHEAVDAFTQAIVADSNYAEAYAGLAACYDLMPEYSSTPQAEAYAHAIAAANKAISLDPSNSVAHRALAFGLFWSQTDVPRAYKEFQEAIRLAPQDAEAHHWYATALNSVLRTAEARKEIDIAQQLSPASRSIVADQAWIRYWAGDKQAVAELHELENAEPDFRSPADFLARIDLAQGDDTGYLEQLHRLATLSKNPADVELVSAAQKGWKDGGNAGMLRAIQTIQEQAFARNQSDGYELAHTCAMLGEKPQAMKYLEAALAAKDHFVLDTLRTDWATPLNGYAPFENFRAQIRRRFGITSS
jgi:tetratricopeptide (TPR) repeat protein